MAAPAPPRRPQRFWSSAGRLLGLLAPQRRALVLVLLAGTVSVALNVWAPLVLGRAMDVIFTGVLGRDMPAGATRAEVAQDLRDRGEQNLADLVSAAVEQAGQKNRPARLDDVRLEPLSEGRCVQTLHLGSFDDEAAVLERMHDEFIPENGLRMVGRHHEIYLSDARRTPPHRLRTMLRQPVERSSDHRGAGQAPESGHQEDGLSPRG